MSRIYVASSWRCTEQPAVVQALRDQGHEVYDFRNPPGKSGFGWSEIDPDWQSWSVNAYREQLDHPELMYRMVDKLATSLPELLAWSEGGER